MMMGSHGLGNADWAHPIEVEVGAPATGADAIATAAQLVWSASAPNHVAPVVIHTNRHDPVPLRLFEYAARVTLWVAEPATLTAVSLVDAPEVNFTDGSSNSREEALIPE
jgi:hypothetical protein